MFPSFSIMTFESFAQDPECWVVQAAHRARGWWRSKCPFPPIGKRDFNQDLLYFKDSWPHPCTISLSTFLWTNFYLTVWTKWVVHLKRLRRRNWDAHPHLSNKYPYARRDLVQDCNLENSTPKSQANFFSYQCETQFLLLWMLPLLNSLLGTSILKYEISLCWNYFLEEFFLTMVKEKSFSKGFIHLNRARDSFI